MRFKLLLSRVVASIAPVAVALAIGGCGTTLNEGTSA
jgi:hypothetical protein